MKLNLSLPKSLKQIASRAKPAHLLLAAALFHLAVVLLIFAIGRWQLMPSQFDDNGLGTFAADGYVYQMEVVHLAKLLKTEGIAAWASWPTQLHVRLYALVYAAFEPGLNLNVLTIEPLNLFYYLAILVLVFKSGETLFDRRTGLLAATIVALWPSLLLHSTQLLRDPPLITAMLLMVLAITKLLKHDYTWQQGLLVGGYGAAAVVSIWIVRVSLWDMVLALTALGCLLLLLSLWRMRRIRVANLIGMAMILTAIAVTPQFKARLETQQRSAVAGRTPIAEIVQKLKLWQRIAQRRKGFVDTPSMDLSPPGSNIDTGVRFWSEWDMIRYLPRALEIGLFAPFPKMWLARGSQVGLAGRLISGFEMTLTYLLQLLAVAALWRRRKDLTVWYWLLSYLVGALALGLIIVNIGSLYRIRYPFWIMLAVVGAGGAIHLLSKISLRKSAEVERQAVVV
jgi:hypothetical protein